MDITIPSGDGSVEQESFGLPAATIPSPYAFAEKSTAKRRMATALFLGTIGLFSICAFRQQVDATTEDQELAMAKPSEDFARLAAAQAASDSASSNSGMVATVER